MGQFIYEHEATSLEGFIQQLAIGYVIRGYYYYVCGAVPERISPHHNDQNILKKFDVARSKFSKYRRRKQRGPEGRPLANCQYIRFRDYWVLLCEDGSFVDDKDVTDFFAEHTKQDSDGNLVKKYSDVRRVAIKYGGYSIGYSNERLSVRMEGKAFRELKRYYLGMARAPIKTLMWEFGHFPYVSYGGILKQTFAILKAVNVIRAAATLKPIPTSCVQVRRRPVKPFEQPKELRRRQEAEQQLLLAA